MALDPVQHNGNSTMSRKVMAGEVMAGEVIAGEVMAGEVIAGEVMAGEVMAGESSGSGSRQQQPHKAAWLGSLSQRCSGGPCG
ncbi:uncharacterized protein EKO05_0009354 [Ascochyta rabiei]|uniref:uncharacterized protein n=1 Tax=Didymella rabiei TaxID=5454 RepID=UPI002200EE3E|nr:uncharacterized protein EKO05_0009354 [Ascochyta rabiei]UPX19078.1 hypothetical protein EKO05_0009354 [Ascochyta rabiei]